MNFHVSHGQNRIRAEIWATVLSGKGSGIQPYGRRIDQCAESIMWTAYGGGSKCLAFSFYRAHGWFWIWACLHPGRKADCWSCEDMSCVVQRGDTYGRKALQSFHTYRKVENDSSISFLVLGKWKSRLATWEGKFWRNSSSAINGGYCDTDCTAATVGAFLGAWKGTGGSAGTNGKKTIEDRIVTACVNFKTEFTIGADRHICSLGCLCDGGKSVLSGNVQSSDDIFRTGKVAYYRWLRRTAGNRFMILRYLFIARITAKKKAVSGSIRQRVLWNMSGRKYEGYRTGNGSFAFWSNNGAFSDRLW